MRFQKVYLEISNVCNLRCAFCPGTRRKQEFMTEETFRALLPKLRPWTDYLYLHLMGEPLLHPLLDTFLTLAGEAGFRVILTTNGTLLSQRQDMLLSRNSLHKVNISLHAFEANDLAVPFFRYLADCFAFGQAAQGRCIVTYRLWNNGGQDLRNREILDAMAQAFPGEWIRERRGTRICDRVYLEYGDKFDWPDLSAASTNGRCFCYGLRDQVGVLVDGTVVPCCLDHEGDLALGDLKTQSLDQILATPRARGIYDGFSQGRAMEELCRRCGYAQRFK